MSNTESKLLTHSCLWECFCAMKGKQQFLSLLPNSPILLSSLSAQHKVQWHQDGRAAWPGKGHRTVLPAFCLIRARDWKSLQHTKVRAVAAEESSSFHRRHSSELGSLTVHSDQVSWTVSNLYKSRIPTQNLTRPIHCPAHPGCVMLLDCYVLWSFSAVSA